MKLKKLSAVLFVLVILSIAIYTFSWFQNNDEVSVKSKDNIEVVVGDNMLVKYMKADGTYSAYGSSININFGTLLSDAEIKEKTLTDITGDGITFSQPKNLDENDLPMAPLDVIKYDGDTYAESLDKMNGYFIELKLMITSSAAANVYLSNNSYVKPATEVKDLTEWTLYDQVIEKNIAGAVRVAFVGLDENEEEEVVGLWIPNDRYELLFGDINEPDQKDRVQFRTNGNRESSYGYLTNSNPVGSLVRHDYSVDDYITGKVRVGNSRLVQVSERGATYVATTGLCGDQEPLLRFSGTVGEEKELTIRIWVEGTDREADKAYNQGSIQYKISLFGLVKQEKEDDELSTLYIDNNSVLRSSNPLLDLTLYKYSYNGIDWFQYNNGFQDISEHNTVILKKREDINYRYTNYVTLTKPVQAGS